MHVRGYLTTARMSESGVRWTNLPSDRVLTWRCLVQLRRRIAPAIPFALDNRGENGNLARLAETSNDETAANYAQFSGVIEMIIIVTIVTGGFPRIWINSDSMDTIQSNVRNEAWVLSLLFIVFSPRRIMRARKFTSKCILTFRKLVALRTPDYNGEGEALIRRRVQQNPCFSSICMYTPRRKHWTVGWYPVNSLGVSANNPCLIIAIY